MRNPRYASGLVFGNPITLSPGLKSPRFFEQFHTLKSLQHISLCDNRAGALQTTML